MRFAAQGMAPYGSEPCTAHRAVNEAASGGITVLILDLRDDEAAPAIAGKPIASWTRQVGNAQ
jgi:hypothetical protein